MPIQIPGQAEGVNSFKVFGRTGVSMVNCSRERLAGEAINLVACAIRTSLQTFRTFSDE